MEKIKKGSSDYATKAQNHKETKHATNQLDLFRLCLFHDIVVRLTFKSLIYNS